MEELEERRKKYEELSERLETTGEKQISTTDPDVRALPLHINIVEVGYNPQSSVDDKHNLIAAYEVTNKKDGNALFNMAHKKKKPWSWMLISP